jgi:hypothetical protein
VSVTIEEGIAREEGSMGMASQYSSFTCLYSPEPDWRYGEETVRLDLPTAHVCSSPDAVFQKYTSRLSDWPKVGAADSELERNHEDMASFSTQ